MKVKCAECGVPIYTEDKAQKYVLIDSPKIRNSYCHYECAVFTKTIIVENDENKKTCKL